MKLTRKQGENFNDAIYLKFDYDPSIITKLKSYRQRYYHADTKEWELPASMEETVRKDFPDEFDYVPIDEPIDLKPIKTELVLGDLPSDFSFKVKPYEHQIEGVRFGVAHDKFLLGDLMGLGKSMQALNISLTKKDVQHCLIICGVNTIKWNWLKEVKVFTDKDARFLGQRIGKRSGKIKIGTTKDKLEDLKNFDKIKEFYIITNIESLRPESIAKELAKLCSEGKIQMIVLDEAHKCNNPDSEQTKGLLGLNCKYKIAMTGTPIMNKPIDLYTIFNWLGIYKDDYDSFKKHYCKLKLKQARYKDKKGRERIRRFWDIVGWRNLEELQLTLGKIMLRRLKEEVLDLPDKTYIDEYVEMDDKQGNLYDLWEGTSEENVNNPNQKEDNAMVKVLRLRQVTGYPENFEKGIESAKLNRMAELVEEAVSNGKSVVVYTNWLTMSKAICEKLKDYKLSVIVGGMSDNARNEEERKFQAGETQVLVGTMKAMGTGLTFTRGSVEIFVDEPWTSADKEQCVDRCHRIGQDNNVTIYTLITKDTVDEGVHEIVLNKGNMSAGLVDNGKLTKKGADFLLKKNTKKESSEIEDDWISDFLN